MVGTISQNTGGGLYDVLRSTNKSQGGAPVEPVKPGESVVENLAVQAPKAAGTHTASTNLMSRNFTSVGGEESKYIKAAKAGFQSDAGMANRQNAILNAGLAQLNSLSVEQSDNYAIRSLVGRQAARRILQEQQQAASEESERNLEEIKEGVAKRAEEATAPADANDAPAPAAGSSGTLAPMPEVSGSEPASAPDVQTAPVADAPAAPSPDVAVAPAQASPSLDITV